jgi:hypothetical protein
MWLAGEGANVGRFHGTRHVETKKTLAGKGFGCGNVALRQRLSKVPAQGLEQPENSSEKARAPRAGGAESGAVHNQHPAADTNLATVVEAWPRLPEAIRAGILAMVRSST